MAEETWEVFDTREFQCSVGASSAIHLSQSNQIALSTSRGLIVLNVSPDPRFQSKHVNLKMSLIPQDSSTFSNPVLHRLAHHYDFEGFLANLTSTEDATFILDTVLPSTWKQFDGPKNLKQIVSLLWSPPCKTLDNKSLLATLSSSHHMQIAFSNHGAGEWRNIDVSSLLYDYLKKNQWSMKNFTTFNHVSNQKMGKLLSKGYIVATTSLCWSSSTLVSENFTQLLLYVGQKSGHIFLCEIKVGNNQSPDEISQGFSVHSWFATEMGSISSISCSCINETNDHLLFVGGKDGRVKLFRTRWSKENIEMTDLGFLWEEKDNISVCLIKLIPSRNNTRTTILIAKGYFLIKLVIELPITNDKKVIVVQHSCTIVGGSSITSICEASGGTFIVFCREGVPKLFEPSNTEIIMKPFSLESSQILDFKNQSNNGAFLTGCGNLLVLCQNGDIGKRFTSGKLTFLVRKMDIFETLESAHSLAPLLFEYIRLKVTENFIEDSYKRLIGISQSKKTNPQTGLWILSLLESACSKLETVEELQKVSDLLDKNYMTILSDRAKYLISLESLPEASKTAATAYLQNQTKKTKLLIKSWNCKLCGSGMSEKSAETFDSYLCKTGHAWPMCTLSLQVCDSLTTQKCSWCHAVASGELDETIFGSACTFCSGIFE